MAARHDHITRPVGGYTCITRSRMKTIASIVIILAILIGCDDGRPEQIVRVLDSAGRPVTGVRVQYNCESCAENPVAYTDKDGIADNPKRGMHTGYVTIDKAGYKYAIFTPATWPVTITVGK